MAAVIDQQFNGGTPIMQIHYTAAVEDEIGQAFTPSVSDTIPFIDLKLSRNGTPVGNLSIQIMTDNAGVPSGTVIANGTSQTVDAGALSTSETVIRFTFSTPPSVIASTKYHITTLATYANSTVNNVVWTGDNTTGTGVSWLVSTTWTNQPNNRLWFDQYRSNNPSVPGSVFITPNKFFGS